MLSPQLGFGGLTGHSQAQPVLAAPAELSFGEGGGVGSALSIELSLVRQATAGCIHHTLRQATAGCIHHTLRPHQHLMMEHGVKFDESLSGVPLRGRGQR